MDMDRWQQYGLTQKPAVIDEAKITKATDAA